MSNVYLGVEGGGTKTVAIWAHAAGTPLHRLELGPSNLRLQTNADFLRLLRSIRKAGPAPRSIGFGLAGCRTERDQQRVRQLAAQVWPGVPIAAGSDLVSALLAMPARHQDRPRVLVISGTGSALLARMPNGETARFGGWGHVLGDKGSGYEIGLRGLKAIVYYFDRDQTWSVLGQTMLARLQLNSPEDLIDWAQAAGKKEIAALAPCVFEAWKKKDVIARDILEGAAASLAKDVHSCAAKLLGDRKAKKPAPIDVVFTGSVLTQQPRFADWVLREIKKLRPASQATVLDREGAWGAWQMAREALGNSANVADAVSTPLVDPRPTSLPESSEKNLLLSPTEQRHPDSMSLDKMPLGEAIALMLREDEKIPVALLAERKKIEKVVRWVAAAFQGGHRLFYVGAGTSGRLGVLDASECPPTFNSPPEQVQGMIAGGPAALVRSIEGAEDRPEAGEEAVRFRGVRKGDVVIGIAASGRTPFVWGALAEARRRQARTVLLCFNPQVKLPKDNRPDLVLAPAIGPEILTGSTRLKSGTATKLLLNIFTTLAMVQCGKVRSNLMIDVQPTNRKLKARVVRIARELTGWDEGKAIQELERVGWRLREIRLG